MIDLCPHNYVLLSLWNISMHFSDSEDKQYLFSSLTETLYN